MKRLLALALCSFAYAQPCYTTAAGDIEKVEFASKAYGNTRTLRVLLPPGYRLAADGRHRYAVLYMNDGQNLYDVCTATPRKQEWRVDETVAELTQSGDIPQLIVVGIDRAASDETDAGRKLYPQFLLNEVVPYIEQRFRTRPGPANRVLGGSSYGAAAALTALIARPGSFYGLLLESPSIEASTLQDAASVTDWPKRVFVGTDTMESVQELQAMFSKAGLDERRMRVVVQEGGQPNEVWWAKRLPDALRFLFGVR